MTLRTSHELWTRLRLEQEQAFFKLMTFVFMIATSASCALETGFLLLISAGIVSSAQENP
jgi:hypothetical protein